MTQSQLTHGDVNVAKQKSIREEKLSTGPPLVINVSDGNIKSIVTKMGKEKKV